MRSFRHPVTNGLVFGLPIMVIFLVLVSVLLSRLDRIVNPRPFYSEMPESLRVLESRMLWVETTNGPRIYVIGILTNRSEIPWRDVEFQCRFYDTNGGMIDAAYPGARLTILPGGDAAFRGVVVPGCARPDYHTLTVTVSSARNTRGLY